MLKINNKTSHQTPTKLVDKIVVKFVITFCKEQQSLESIKSVPR